MSAAIAEDTLPAMQRGLSDWWTEETEYVFQRIERWAAFARGYNRLRSQRYSRGRLTMTEEPVEPGWNISANKLVVEDGGSWNPRFHNLQRSRRQRKSRPAEETRINCCGSFNYQSNNNLDSPCLETYRYDHSIYFKTIGEIRNGGRNRKCSLRRAEESPGDLSPETSDQEQVEWRANTCIGEIECHRCNDDDDDDDDDNLETDVYEFLSKEHKETLEFGGIDLPEKNEKTFKSSKSSQVWPIVDLTQLDIKTEENICSYNSGSDNEGFHGNHTIIQIDELDDEEDNINNNMNNNHRNDDDADDNSNNNKSVDRNVRLSHSPEIMRGIPKAEDSMTIKRTDQSLSLKRQEESKRLVSIRRTRQSPRKVSQPVILGENNVVWPGVLLNYKKNVDPVDSPHRHSIKKK